jgi:hypothetical protein
MIVVRIMGELPRKRPFYTQGAIGVSNSGPVLARPSYQAVKEAKPQYGVDEHTPIVTYKQDYALVLQLHISTFPNRYFQFS